MKELEYPFQAEELLLKKKKIRRMLKGDLKDPIKKRIAVLGGSTTASIIQMMELFLLNQNIEPEFYESEYNKYYEDAIFGNEIFDEFKPDVIYICTSSRNIVDYPHMQNTEEEVESLLKFEMEKYERIWKSLSEKYRCPIIQNNFEMPNYRLLGNRDVFDFHGRTNYIYRLNKFFNEYAKEHENFFICDINYISADYGLAKWYDEQAFYMYKYACSLSAIPYLAFNVSNIIKSIFGKNKKGFVLDLDNTLWGGIVGDDGVEQLELGPETPQGEAYLAFQKYIKQHQQLGIILNINSKNEYENAIAGIRHPDSVFSEKDFITIKANWNTKDRNLQEIAEELNLGVESLVFLDDNPAERSIIEQSFPRVSTPVMDDVTRYIHVIDRSGFFEVSNYSEDDIKRNEMYQKNAERKKQQAKFTDYEDYLKSLEMKAVIKSFEKVYFERITQLTNKSNQYNFTTKRYTQNEIEEIAVREDYITLYGKLMDCFGDNGLVAVVIGRIDGRRCHIEEWLMSCRVLKRNMEFAMLDELVQACREKGICELIGYYYPTAKNHMVKDAYESFGFRCIDADEDGSAVWSLDITRTYNRKNQCIVVEDKSE